MKAWNEGRSDKHPKDISDMIAFDLSGSSDIPIDYEMVTEEAARIGQETLDMWTKTLARAKEEIEKGNTPRKW